MNYNDCIQMGRTMRSRCHRRLVCVCIQLIQLITGRKVPEPNRINTINARFILHINCKIVIYAEKCFESTLTHCFFSLVDTICAKWRCTVGLWRLRPSNICWLDVIAINGRVRFLVENSPFNLLNGKTKVCTKLKAICWIGRRSKTGADLRHVIAPSVACPHIFHR